MSTLLSTSKSSDQNSRRLTDIRDGLATEATFDELTNLGGERGRYGLTRMAGERNCVDARGHV